MPQMHRSLVVYCAALDPPSPPSPRVVRRSHFRRQSVSASVRPERPLAAKGGTVGENDGRKFCLNGDFHTTFRDLLRATSLRHGIDGFTSLPKAGFSQV
jgi:hypothetical protein